MPLTLSAKFKVLQNQNYYGYHITGGKLFCTSVLNSDEVNELSVEMKKTVPKEK